MILDDCIKTPLPERKRYTSIFIRQISNYERIQRIHYERILYIGKTIMMILDDCIKTPLPERKWGTSIFIRQISTVNLLDIIRILSSCKLII